MTEVPGPRHGVTVRAHVEGSLASAFGGVSHVWQQVREQGRRLTKAQREELSRELAGVISDCESVRLWIAAGCPEA